MEPTKEMLAPQLNVLSDARSANCQNENCAGPLYWDRSRDVFTYTPTRPLSLDGLTEGVGFEPTSPFGRRFSRPVH